MSDNPATSLGPSSIMKHFSYYGYSKEHVRVIKPICDLAIAFDKSLGNSAEKAVVLRKLLEAKDAAIRAVDEDFSFLERAFQDHPRIKNF